MPSYNHHAFVLFILTILNAFRAAQRGSNGKVVQR